MRSGRGRARTARLRARLGFSRAVRLLDGRRRAAGSRRRGSTVKRALDTLDELGDIVQRKPRLQIAQIAGGYLEGPPLGGNVPARQPLAQRFVDDLAKGSAGAPLFRLELGRDIVVQGERRSHVLMLDLGH